MAENHMLRVLIVDDEEGMRLGARRVLTRGTMSIREMEEDVRFEADVAETGAEAFAKLADTSYDLMLLDYKLPDMSGLEILERLRDENADMLIVMVTAYASLDVAVSATKNGAFDFLAKPFTPDELTGVVRKAVRSLVIQRRARRLEEEKRTMRFEFLSVLSHELKAPIGAVEGYLNVMKDHTAGDSIEAYDSMIRRSLARLDGMRKLIYDLLDLTRIESGQKKRELTGVDVVECATTCIENVQPDADARGIAVRLDAPETVSIHGDAGEVEIILNNFISNAVKYNRDGGRVDIRLAREGDRVAVEVSDTGIGMTPEEKDKLFGEFVRIRNDKTRHIPGSGLGLSTVKKLAGFYDGEIEVESEPDRGSTFRIFLKDSRPA